jgi:peptidoglycan/LPS O-acetylase OafA/YrhL
LSIAAFFSISMVAAVVAYHLIEAPLVELGRRLTA